jgi:hypothetical protein
MKSRSKTTKNTLEAVTLADLCEALADRKLPANVEDGFYVIQRKDLQRLGRPVNIPQIITLLEVAGSKPMVAAS